MSTLFPGQSLLPGQSLKSDNGLYTLTMQSDGNVVLRDSASTPLWRTGTGGGQFVPRDFIMQTDGNLVLYDTSGQARWNSKTPGNPGAFLNVQDDGNLVVYRAGSATETVGNSLWSSGTNVPPPLTLTTVVEGGATLNVGNADLDNISKNMLLGVDPNSGAVLAPYTEQGSWSWISPGPVPCGLQSVTVNADIDAWWHSGPSWTSSQLRDGLAGALQAVMQAMADKTAYQNYSYTYGSDGGNGVFCEDPQFLSWGHYIPPKIQITAYNNGGAAIGQVTVTYSTGDGQSGGSACDTINGLVDGLLPLVLDDAVAAVVGTAMTVICDLIDG